MVLRIKAKSSTMVHSFSPPEWPKINVVRAYDVFFGVADQLIGARIKRTNGIGPVLVYRRILR